ncbi:alpha/beta hydrolase [Eupransor demetentiae]|uniref:Uncharacterized conserved protein with an alpha/beta hydrolase fold n=1 Tax=Eupransor demetentiae TaxID=3109584 RepID=A0ABP0EP00_9LACO|nr:Uncharacterized conserved protein with an alpha/beta hydrolase fold [Lactobacillaceae bacterium LMG 33000]
MNKKIGITAASLILLVLAGLVIWLGMGQSKSSKSEKVEDYQTPTLYLHGYGGGKGSTKSLIAYAQQHAGAKQVLQAKVDKAGTVELKGNWKKGTKRPLIQVLFEDNRNSDFNDPAAWLKAVVLKLQKEYDIKHMNIVAHSMGNLSFMYYQANYGQDKSLPQVDHYVALAGHFDGIRSQDDPANQNSIAADGRPAIIHYYYQYLLDHRQDFAMKNTRVDNIYGNLNDGSNSDGTVTVTSARALAYLLKGQVKSYQEDLIEGKQGQHSRLHENNKVAAKIDDFLWS